MIQVREYSEGCLMPRVEDIMVPWSRIKNHTEPSLLLEQTYQDSCTGNYYLLSTFFLVIVTK